ncbi:MAG: erythromycin esterase family protein, partial [Gemmatimonadaceae bacterium]
MKLAERQRLLSPIFSIVVSIAFATSARAQRPLNLGFERLTTQGTGRPWGWSPVYGGGDVSMDTTVRHGGSYSLRVTRTSFSSTDGGDEWASLRLFIPPLVAQRNLMQLTVWTRAEGSAMPRVAIEAWAPGLVLSADSEAIVTQRAATAWTKQRLRISNVDTSTFAVVVTVGIQGSGTVWFDDLSLEVGGRRVESVPVAPAFTGGNVAWIDARTVTLTGVEPPSSESVPAEDLAAVDKIIGSARVIALGEDTHGTSEFFQLKDRVLRYLVERRGLRIFAIEANQLAVEGINRYVHGAAGNARTVMRAMFQVWNTTEMEALVEWMRARNAQYPSDQVSFVGYDMQDPSLPIDSVQAFLDRRQPELSASVRAMY